MARIYVGNLPLDTREKDVEDLFWKVLTHVHGSPPIIDEPRFTFMHGLRSSKQNQADFGCVVDTTFLLLVTHQNVIPVGIAAVRKVGSFCFPTMKKP